MKKYLVILILCLTGVALAIEILPENEEVALMYMRDKEFQVALDAYEKQREKGDMSVNTVGTLSQLYLQHGEVEKAITLMEAFIKENPNNIEARKKIGRFYQFAQRTEDYQNNLEYLASVEPKEEYYRELADMYNYSAQYDKQQDALEKLVAIKEHSPTDLLKLVQLKASTGEKVKALQHMLEYAKKYPGKMDREHQKLLFRLMIDNKKYDEAAHTALLWSKEGKFVDALPYYAFEVARYKDTDAALAILRPHQDKIKSNPEILASIVDLQRARGENKAIFEQLAGLHKSGGLPDTLRPVLTELAIDHGKDGYVLQLVKESDLTTYPEMTLLGLTEQAATTRFPGLHGVIASKLTDDYLNARPVLKTAVILGGNDKAAKQAHVQTVQYKNIDVERRARLAILLSKNGYSEKAGDVLATLPTDDSILDPMMPSIAMAFAEAKRTTEGEQFFTAADEHRDHANIAIARIMMSAANGNSDATAEWMKANADTISDRTLLDLYYITNNAGNPELALTFAEFYHKRKNNNLSAITLAESYINAHMPEKAIPLLEDNTYQSNERVQEMYMLAMQRAVMGKRLQGEERRHIQDKLVKQLVAQLNNKRLPQEKRDEAVYALINLGERDEVFPIVSQLAYKDPSRWGEVYVDLAMRQGKKNEAQKYIIHALKQNSFTTAQKGPFISLLLEQNAREEALPHLRELALTRGGNWVFAYEEALVAMGREKEIIPIWLERAKRKGTPEKELRIIAYKLADLGMQKEAADIQFRVARDKPADSPEVEQLLYLWNGNPPAAGGDWLTYRAVKSTGAERAVWFKHMIQAGENKRVTELMKDTPANAAIHPDIQFAYIQALLNTRQYDRANAVIEPAFAQETEFDRVLFLANAARDSGNNDLARQGYEKLLDTGVYAPYILRDLGDVTYFEGEFKAAKYYYDHYFTFEQTPASEGDADAEAPITERDIQTHLRLGLINKRLGHIIGAHTHLNSTITLVDLKQEKTRNTQLAKAKALYNLGEYDKARPAYQALYDKHPKDREIAADYAEMLMNRERLEEARAIIDATRSQDSVKTAAIAQPLTGSTEEELLRNDEIVSKLRLELLHAELLLLEGHVQESLEQYQLVETNYPENVYPKIGQAVIQDYRGNWKQALLELDDAITVNPDNVDLQRARKQIYDKQRSSVTVDMEYKDVDSAEEIVTTTVKGHVLRDNHDKVGFEVQKADMQISDRALIDGQFGDYDDNSYRAEVYYEHHLDSGDIVRGGVLGSATGPGLKFSYAMPDNSGVTTLTAEYNRAYWDIPEAIIQEASRDKLEATRTLRIRDNVFALLGTNLNNYSVDVEDNITQSLGFEASLGYRVRRIKPSVTVMYGLDAEYLFDDQTVRIGPDGAYQPFPLVSREVHSLGVNVSDTYMDTFFWELYAGYAVDRLGGNGEFYGGAIEYAITDRLSAGARAGSSYNNNGQGGRVKRAGGHLTFKF